MRRSGRFSRARRIYLEEGAAELAKRAFAKARAAASRSVSGVASTGSRRLSSVEDLAAALGLAVDEEYCRARTILREPIAHRLAGCAPADAPASEMEGYVTEASLRFAVTLEWLASAVQALPTSLAARILEAGSNPYFMTILVADRLPRAEHLGINYFGDSEQVGTYVVQSVIERDSLAAIGQFGICLFCEVLEHLPFDPAWALLNLARQLAVGGRLILSTPNPARFENIRRLVFHDGSKDDPISGYGLHGRHNREYTVAELRDLLSGTGFRVCRSTTLDASPTRFSRAAERLGHGEYILVEAELARTATLYRPPWLYRSFPRERLESPASLAPGCRV
jgi:SAM-dependent methyltransferase